MKGKIFIISSILFLIAVFFTVNNCSDSPVSSNRDVVFPDSLVSYTQHIEPFLRVKCSFCPCHCLSPQNGASVMTDYFALFSSENLGLIIPLKPDNSLIVQVIEEKIPHNPYFQANYINANQKHGIRQWIIEGAKNN